MVSGMLDQGSLDAVTGRERGDLITRHGRHHRIAGASAATRWRDGQARWHTRNVVAAGYSGASPPNGHDGVFVQWAAGRA